MMSLVQKLAVFYGWLAVCTIGFIVLLAVGLPIYGLLLLLSVFAIAFFVTCPNCGKSVFVTELSRTDGISVGNARPWPRAYRHPWPEVTCSRCGISLFADE
jgi:hypothetical protein